MQHLIIHLCTHFLHTLDREAIDFVEINLIKPMKGQTQMKKSTGETNHQLLFDQTYQSVDPILKCRYFLKFSQIMSVTHNLP